MEFIELGVASGLMLLTFLLGLHVAAALGLISLTLLFFFSDRPMWEMLGLIAWNTNTSFVLIAIPLFVLMGEILLRSGLTEKLYRVMSKWLSYLPGGLLHSNIAACAVFAAASGSSAATAATIGSVALPSFSTRGYSERMVIGSLAAGGTLGILIPPSISFIVYGGLMEVSIGRLYIAGIIPGIILSLSFMMIIFIVAIVSPTTAPREAATPWRDKLFGLIEMLPTVMLIFLVIGTIYLGVATPTEAAAFGVVGAVFVAFKERCMSLQMLKEVFLATSRTTAMVMLILTSAFILNSTLAILGVPYAMAQKVASLNLTPTTTLVCLIIFYLVLGTFMEGFSMMVTTIPVILPIIKAMNIDLVWFGVIAVILTEAAIISPPEGVNLYIIHGLRQGQSDGGRKKTIMDVYIGVMPFFLMILAVIALIVAFPQICLWLPNTMKGQ